MLFAIFVGLSVALAVCAVIAAAGGRHVFGLCGFSAAFTAQAEAFIRPGHYSLASAVALVCCAGALLVTAAAVAVRRKRAS